jgi:hypothetical protein
MDRPNLARMHDYFLGGAHNFAVDREAAGELARAYPEAAAAFRGNRSFLRRAVGHLVNAGIDQFLDLGAGIPTVGSVHEIAQRGNPDARVAYVDIDPVAVAHSRTILRGNPNAIAVRADLRQPESILDHHDVRALLDLNRPIAALMIGVLHFVPDSDDPAGILAGYRRAMASGSYLVISHGSQEAASRTADKPVESVTAIYQHAHTPVALRTRAEITKLFDGLRLVPPGLVPSAQWHPDSNHEPAPAFVGVGQAP